VWKTIRPYILWSTLTVLVVAIGFLLTSRSVVAQTSEVKLQIPAGSIQVEGKTSPGSHVKIFQNNNTEPVASVSADSLGAFSAELPQEDIGMVSVGVQSTDINGRNTPKVFKQIAVLSQQKTYVTFILPPSITVSPSTATFGIGLLIFSGQTIPDATVMITIEPNITITATSDGQGKFSAPFSVSSLPTVGVFTFGVEVIAGLDESGYFSAGTITIAPPTPPPIEPPLPGTDDPHPNQPSQDVSPPEISFPTGEHYTSTEPIVISGRAEPGSIITIYDDGVAIGSVTSNLEGIWEFYFTPYKSNHSITVVSCKDTVCSEPSRPIVIRGPDRESRPCGPLFTLSEHKLTALTGAPANLAGRVEHEDGIDLFINWGDDKEESLSNVNGKVELSHPYSDEGIYSGYVIAKAGEGCQTATQFTVHVKEPQNSVSWQIITIIICSVAAGMLFLLILLIRRRKNNMTASY
jgi:hypothetical protein